MIKKGDTPCSGRRSLEFEERYYKQDMLVESQSGLVTIFDVLVDNSHSLMGNNTQDNILDSYILDSNYYFDDFDWIDCPFQ